MGQAKEYPCRCGCNEMTTGEFVQGHRAAFEAAERVRQEAERAATMNELVKGFTSAKPPPAEEVPPAPPASEEASGKPCLCGCGTLVSNRAQLAKGHHWRLRRAEEAESAEQTDNTAGVAQTAERVLTVDEAAVQSRPPAAGPPQYGPVDGRRWRLAEDKLNTPKTNPWIETRCSNCSSQMWTRDPANTYQNAGLCQECIYYLMSELGDYGQRQYRTQARTLYDPFRPR